MPNRQVDAVIFDFGAVIVNWDPYAAMEGHYTRAEVDEAFERIDFRTHNHAQDAGRPWAELRQIVAAKDAGLVEFIDCYLENFPKSITGLIDGTTEVIDELKAAGIGVFGLTNWSAETYPAAPKAAPVIGRLDGVVVSGQEGLAKPDPRLFQIAIDRFGVEPGRTAFVDDQVRNIVAAEEAGLVGLVFTDAAELRDKLVQLGALPA